MNKKQRFPLYPTAGPVTTYSYDNLIALTDAENQRTEFACDRHNRLIRETRPMGQQTTRVEQDVIDAPRGGYELVRIPGGEFLNLRRCNEPGAKIARIIWVDSRLQYCSASTAYRGRITLSPSTG